MFDRRDLVWINVTTNPTAEWIARQITEAFPWDDAPQHLIRDRDRIGGPSTRGQIAQGDLKNVTYYTGHETIIPTAGGWAWPAGAKRYSPSCITTPRGLAHISTFRARKLWRSASSLRSELMRNSAASERHSPTVILPFSTALECTWAITANAKEPRRSRMSASDASRRFVATHQFGSSRRLSGPVTDIVEPT